MIGYEASTHAGSLGGNTAHEVLGVSLAHLVDGGGFETSELGETRGLHWEEGIVSGVRCG